MKAYRGTLFLLAALIGLAALVYASEGRGAAATPTKPAVPVVWTVPEEQIAELAVSGEGQRTALAKDAAGGWQLVAPQTAPADEWQLK